MTAPTAMKATWFPSIVTLPDGTVHRTCRVYATDTTLDVYTAPGTLAYSSPIDYGRTPRPTKGQMRSVFTVHTDGGDVQVQRQRGCGCGNPLKRWSPEYARKAVAW